MPGIFTLTEPRWLRLLKARRCQSAAPRAALVAAEGDVRGGRRPVHDAPELLAARVHDPDPAGAAAVDVALHVDLHAVWHARLVATEIGEDAVGLLGERAVREQIERADVLAARVVDVEHALVRRERQPAGQHKIVNEQGVGAEPGSEAIYAREGEIPLLGGEGTRPRVGEVDTAVGLDHDVVGTVEPLAFEAVRDHGEAAIELEPRDPPAVVLAGDQPAL